MDMNYRKLGRTGLSVGVIGLGTEHLEDKSIKTNIEVIHEAMDHGVNYLDFFWSTPRSRDHLGAALNGRRDKMIVEAHLGNAFLENQHTRTRNRKEVEEAFHDLLTRLQTDYIDVLMLHFVDEQDDYEQVFGLEGIYELALQYQKEGKARFIGMSSHVVPIALQAVNSGKIDVLMFPVNPLYDTLSGVVHIDEYFQENQYRQLAERNKNPDMPEHRDLYYACARNEVSMVAMKPYAAGWLFNPNNPSSVAMTPVQCLHYALSQPGVIVAVPGCKNVDELHAALSYINASEEEKNYSERCSRITKDMKKDGICMYCNHCLPCPSVIDIGKTLKLSDVALTGMSLAIQQEYSGMSAKADDCIACGACMKLCPFGVDVIDRMRETAKLFEV